MIQIIDNSSRCVGLNLHDFSASDYHGIRRLLAILLMVFLVSACSEDETPGITVTPLAGLVTDEGGKSDSISIVLNAKPDAPVSIPLSSSNEAEGTLSTNTVNFTPGDWLAPKVVTINGVDDGLVDGDASYKVIFSATSSGDNRYNGIQLNPINAVNLDNDLTSKPVAGVTVSTAAGLTTSESGGATTLTLSLNTQPTGNVSITTTSMDTTEGTVSPNNLLFTTTNWDLPQTITVSGVDDDIADGNTSYDITFDVQSTDTDYAGLTIPPVTLSNSDNDLPAGLTVTPNSGLRTSENGTTASFAVALNSQPIGDVNISLISSDNGEGTVAPASLVFTTNNWNLAQSVIISGIDDAIVDGDISYSVAFNIQSSDSAYAGMIVAPVSVTNEDNDVAIPAGLTITPTSGLSTSEAGGTATFTLVLNRQPGSDVSVALSSSDTSEGTVSPAVVTFTNVNWDIPRSVTIIGIDDSVVDGNINYSISFDVQSADTDYNGLSVPPLGVTNQDNDVLPPAGVTVTPTSGLITSENGTTDSFTVVLNSQPNNNVTITLSSSDSSEGTVVPGNLVFTNSNWDLAQSVTVTGIDDAAVDGDISYSITLSAQSSDTNYSGITIASVAVLNQDNDTALPAGITVTPSSGLTTDEGGATSTLTVVLNSQPTSTVNISLTSDNTSEGTVSPASLSFSTANWDSPQTVTITGVDDAVVDGNISYNVVFAVQSSDAAYNGLVVPPVAVINQDNDAAPPAGITITPTSGLSVSEDGTTATFSATLNSQPSNTVTVSLGSSDATEGTVSTFALIFTPTNWATPQTVTITGVDDAVVDGDISFAINFNVQSADTGYNGFIIPPLSVLNQDNDSTPPAGISVAPNSGLVTGEDGTTATFTVTLTSLPANTVTVTISSSNTSEGTVSPATLSFTTANWSVAQTVTVSGVDDALVDGDISYDINFNVQSSDSNYNGFTVTPITVINLDNDTAPPAGVTISPLTGLITSEDGTSTNISLALNSQPTDTVTITSSSSNTSEGSVAPTALVFTTANWATTQTVTVTGIDDTLVDGDISYSINFSVQSADTNYNNFTVPSAAVVNQDNDTAPPAGVTISPLTGLITSEDGTATDISVALNSQPTDTVTISPSSSNTSEGSVAPTALVFTTANWATTQTVTVTGIDDALVDGDISYSINFSVQSADSAYDGFSVPSAAATNLDNDVTPGTPDYVLFIEPNMIQIAASTITGNGATSLISRGYALNGPTGTQSPGPVIEAVVGQTVIVEIVNDYNDTHRFEIEKLLTGTAPMAPGDTAQFQFTPTEAGIYRYGDPDLVHRSIGLHGAVVVRPAGSPNTAWTGGPGFDQERTWVITDMDSSWNSNPGTVNPLQYNPNYFLMNGKSGFESRSDPASTIVGGVGERFLIRIVNAGQFDQSLHFHSNHFQVISEGGLKITDYVNAPWATTVNVKRGSTAMLLFTISQAGTYPVHAHSAPMETSNGVYLNGTATFIIGN